MEEGSRACRGDSWKTVKPDSTLPDTWARKEEEEMGPQKSYYGPTKRGGVQPERSPLGGLPHSLRGPGRCLRKQAPSPQKPLLSVGNGGR